MITKQPVSLQLKTGYGYAETDYAVEWDEKHYDSEQQMCKKRCSTTAFYKQVQHNSLKRLPDAKIPSCFCEKQAYDLWGLKPAIDVLNERLTSRLLSTKIRMLNSETKMKTKLVERILGGDCRLAKNVTYLSLPDYSLLLFQFASFTDKAFSLQ